MEIKILSANSKQKAVISSMYHYIMPTDEDLLFQFEISTSLITSIQNYVHSTSAYSGMKSQEAFRLFIQDLVIRFIASFQPTEILLKTAKGENLNYEMFRLTLFNPEISRIFERVGNGRYFEFELKKKLFQVWQSFAQMSDMGLIIPES